MVPTTQKISSITTYPPHNARTIEQMRTSLSTRDTKSVHIRRDGQPKYPPPEHVTSIQLTQCHSPYKIPYLKTVSSLPNKKSWVVGTMRVAENDGGICKNL